MLNNAVITSCEENHIVFAVMRYCYNARQKKQVFQ